MATLIPIYAGYGDCLLLRLPIDNTHPTYRYWLIDGGPITSTRTVDEGDNNAYQQYLRLSLKRYCRRDPNSPTIDNLAGIVVTHPDADHIDGITKLLREWLPDKYSDLPSTDKPLLFHGPIIVNSRCFEPKAELLEVLEEKFFEAVPYEYDGNNDALMHQGSNSRFKLQRTQTSVKQPIVMPNLPLLTIINDPQKLYQGPYVNRTVDQSETNSQSILTSRKDGNDLDIVTTGDGLAAFISFGIRKNTHYQNIPKMNVFKVPHHGSKANSQLGHLRPPSYQDRQNIFLTFALCYLEEKTPPAGAIIDENFLKSIRERITKNLEEGCPTYAALTLDGKKNVRKAFSEVFSTEIGRVSYGKKTGVPKPSLLMDPKALWDLTIDLAKNFEKISEGGPGEAYMDLVKYTTGSKAWALDPLDKNTKIKDNTNVRDTYKYLKDQDSLLPEMVAANIRNFYQTFQAKNYVISANGTHFHPSPPLLAGLISALKYHADQQIPLEKPKIIVTDGKAIKIDEVSRLLRNLHYASAQPINWDNIVSIYFLENDYAVPVPLEPNTGTLGTVSFNVKPTYLNDLNKQFNAALSQDIPRAVDPESSRVTLRCFNTNPAGKTGYVGVDGSGNINWSENELIVWFKGSAPSQRWKSIPPNIHNQPFHGPWLKLVNDTAETAYPIIFLKLATATGNECHVYKDNGEELYYDDSVPGKVSFIASNTPGKIPVQVIMTRVLPT